MERCTVVGNGAARKENFLQEIASSHMALRLDEIVTANAM